MKKAKWWNSKFIYYIILILLPILSKAQDSARAFPMVITHFGFQYPDGDMANRFGPNANFGVGFFYKTKSNIIFGAQWSYMFGSKVKEDSIFRNIKTPQGNIIDIDGKNGAYVIMERGQMASLGIGKVFATKNNKNSGITAIAFLNALQHKIRIQNNANDIPQINNNYRQGYDHLSSGLGAGIFIGYLHVSIKNYFSFYAGLDASIAYTKNRRFNFDISAVDNTQRQDILYGAKIGIVLPIYHKQAEGKFFYD